MTDYVGKILIGCEFSGRVREAFRLKGWDAWSVDFLPSEVAGKHFQGNVLDYINQTWDAFICFPPCQFLCSSGLHWNKRHPERELKTSEAVYFAHQLWTAPIKLICLENSVGRLSTAIRKPDQIIQPYQFGENASKKTCLWLKGFPPLTPTGYYPPRIVNDRQRWGNQTDSGQNRLAPSENRWMERSRTFQGIADAMADQWTKFYLSNR